MEELGFCTGECRRLSAIRKWPLHPKTYENGLEPYGSRPFSDARDVAQQQLTNPSMRSALFSSIEADDQEMGQLAETAVFSQWFHAAYSLHYARWRTGEVDIVCLDDAQRPNWCVEVKWSDAHVDREAELSNLSSFCRVHPNVVASATTRTRSEKRVLNNRTKVSFFPVSLYCYFVGRNTVENKDWRGWLVVN